MAQKQSEISVVLQDRDRALLRGLFESRVMTAEHIAALYFDGRSEMTKKRLQKLKAAGLIAARKRAPAEPAILFLARKGLHVLREDGTLAEYPPLSLLTLEKRANVSTLTIAHELEVMDVKAAFCTAVKKSDMLSIAEFCTWPLLNQFDASRLNGAPVNVRPDGFIRIHEKDTDGGLSEHTFYLEVDRSTESLDILVSRAACYLDYYKSGGFAVKNGAPRSAYKDFPFRVLIVVKSAERRNNLAERLLHNNPPILSHAYLSTLEEVKANPMGAIWVKPFDYDVAAKAGTFACSRVSIKAASSHNYTGESVLRNNIIKHRLTEQ